MLKQDFLKAEGCDTFGEFMEDVLMTPYDYAETAYMEACKRSVEQINSVIDGVNIGYYHGQDDHHGFIANIFTDRDNEKILCSDNRVKLPEEHAVVIAFYEMFEVREAVKLMKLSKFTEYNPEADDILFGLFKNNLDRIIPFDKLAQRLSSPSSVVLLNSYLKMLGYRLIPSDLVIKEKPKRLAEVCFDEEESKEEEKPEEESKKGEYERIFDLLKKFAQMPSVITEHYMESETKSKDDNTLFDDMAVFTWLLNNGIH